MDSEKLIDAVREYPALYDPSHTKYMDCTFKNALWGEIGRKLGTKRNEAKSRWFSLRDTYRKSVKRNATLSGPMAKKIRHYKYAEQLEFLNRFLEERVPFTTVTDDGVDEGIAEGIKSRDSFSSADNEEYSQNIPPEDIPESDVSSPRKSVNHPIPYVQVAGSVKTLPATSDGMEKRNEGASAVSSMQHPVDAFLAGLAPSLKQLPLRHWHYAKAELFAAVQKYELQMLMDEQAVPSVKPHYP